MNQNTVISSAVAAINSELNSQTVNAGVSLVNRTRDIDSKIADCHSRIGTLQSELRALNADQVTVENVFGGSLPTTANSETITKVIEAMNKARQFPVEQKSQRLASAITAEHDAIAALQKQRADVVAELAKLDAPTVTVESIIS